jgi:hypothetical protein
VDAAVMTETVIDTCRRHLPAPVLELFEAAVAGQPLDEAQRAKVVGAAANYLGTKGTLALRSYLLARAKKADPEGHAELMRNGQDVFAGRVADREAVRQRKSDAWMRKGRQYR